MSAAITSSSETSNKADNWHLDVITLQLDIHRKTLEHISFSPVIKISEIAAEILAISENAQFPKHLKHEAEVISGHLNIMASTYETDSETERTFNANGITNRISCLNFEILVVQNPDTALTPEALAELQRAQKDLANRVKGSQERIAHARNWQKNQLGLETITAKHMQANKELLNPLIFHNMDHLKAFFLRWTSDRSNQRMFRRHLTEVHFFPGNRKQLFSISSRVGGQNLSELIYMILYHKELSSDGGRTQDEIDSWIVDLINADANPNDGLFRSYSLASHLTTTSAPISQFAIRILICGGLDVLRPIEANEKGQNALTQDFEGMHKEMAQSPSGIARALEVRRWMREAIEYKQLLVQKVMTTAMAHITEATSSMSYSPLSEVAIAPMRACYNLKILPNDVLPLVMDYVGIPERWLNQLCVDTAVAEHRITSTATAANESNSKTVVSKK